MAEFFNEYDVQDIAFRTRSSSDLAPFGQVAVQFVKTINANSDGWPYWSGGHRAAAKFLGILKAAARSGPDARPETIAALRKAMVPMRSLCTKRGFPALPRV